MDVSKLSHRLHFSELGFLCLSVADERLGRDVANRYGKEMDYEIKRSAPAGWRKVPVFL
jgi:hypothetical protein